MEGNLRTIVGGAYGIQKLRIQTGNRIVANWKRKLGQEPSKKEETIDADGKAILASLRAAFKKLTDGVVKLPKQKTFKGDKLISDYTELCLVRQYISLEAMEAQHFSDLKEALKEYRIYTEFLEGVKGVGPAMAGVIVSEIDIHRARYPSSLWAYAGLDVVSTWRLQRWGIIEGLESAGEQFAVNKENVPETMPLVGEDALRSVNISPDGFELTVTHAREDFKVAAIYKLEDSGGRSRKKHHLVEREYIDKDGKPATRLSITFNPFLKTKLMGVLAASFLRAGKWEPADDITWDNAPENKRRLNPKEDDRKEIRTEQSPYADVYDDYKHRVENRADIGVCNDKKKDDDGKLIASKGRRHNMALRYMTKRFLVDLYKEWRAIEGLEVAPEYNEAKLKMTHVA